MSKKILLINGSQRKENTYNVLFCISEILKTHNMETEILNLFDYQIKDCIGCESCIVKKGCRIGDDMPILMQKIKDSDGVVFGSPVYMSSVTSKLKAFADRTNRWVHKPELAGKPVLFAATTAASGLNKTRNFFDIYATGLGLRKGGFIARKGKKRKLPVEEKEVSRFISLLKRDKSLYRPALNEIVMFNVEKALALKSNGDDRLFWEENNYINKIYYYKCKMNPFKKMFSKLMFKIIFKAIN